MNDKEIRDIIDRTNAEIAKLVGATGTDCDLLDYIKEEYSGKRIIVNGSEPYSLEFECEEGQVMVTFNGYHVKYSVFKEVVKMYGALFRLI